MMAIPMLLILQVLVILCSPLTYSYPVYGTKRYGRSSASWAQYPLVRTQRYPINYYELYPYSQTYPDDYYPQETYPVYYPRTSKYEVYQAVLPYYYGDRPAFNRYGYYDDPLTGIQEEMLQQAEREQREESQPIGHEMLYENEDDQDENLDDVNAAFLQNLIMSQMYKDNSQKDSYDDYYPSYEGYGKWDENPVKSGRYYPEDEDVKELKQLTKSKAAKERNNEDIHWFQRSNFRNQKEHQSRNNYGEKRDAKLSERKPLIKITSTQPPPKATSSAPKRDARGQKEEVLMRPATPVRHPFSSPVLEMMSKSDEKKRAPSVYDTIKHMLDMEKTLENKYNADEIRPQMKKRIVSSEESLTHQLSLLKKSQ